MLSGSAMTIHDRLSDPVRARVPTLLSPLVDLAYDLWWTWHPEARELFESADAERFARAGDDPVALLRELPLTRLRELAEDDHFVRRLGALAMRRSHELSAPSQATWPASPERPIAFFCSEFALHRSLPIYAGGLGVLAGDLLKEASDHAVPMVGVGLLYGSGYFHQRLDPSGWQHEYWLPLRTSHLPMDVARTPEGAPVRFELELEQRRVMVQVFRVQVGRVTLFLLDTNVAENGPVDRFITAQLYVGDPQLRLRQYLLLGVGGVRALRALGIDPGVVHLNEGHPAFASLELLREQHAQGKRWEEALASTRER